MPEHAAAVARTHTHPPAPQLPPELYSISRHREGQLGAKEGQLYVHASAQALLRAGILPQLQMPLTNVWGMPWLPEELDACGAGL